MVQADPINTLNMAVAVNFVGISPITVFFLLPLLPPCKITLSLPIYCLQHCCHCLSTSLDFG